MHLSLPHAAYAALPISALVGFALAHSNEVSVPAPSASTPAVEKGTPVSLYYGDIDGDGLDDALSIDAQGAVKLLSNVSQGQFEDITVASGLAAMGGATCAVFADFDADGAVDLFVGSSEKRVWRNVGNASFAAVDSGIDHDLVDLAASAVDHDQDGLLDIQLHTEAGDLLYRNLGQGRFERAELPGSDHQVHETTTNTATTEGEDSTTTQLDQSPARRRMQRWQRARSLANSATSAGNTGSGNNGGFSSLTACVHSVQDVVTFGCLDASAVPAIGRLYPLSTALNVSAAGNVGVNTTTPNAKLSIANIGGVDGANMLGFGEGGSAEFFFQSGFAASNQNNAVSFATTIGGLGDIMTWQASGNVGIGTTTPTRPLHLVSAQSWGLRIEGDTQPGMQLENYGSGSSWAIYHDANDSLNFRDSTTGATRMVVRGDTGRIGIGTETPTQTLDVVGGGAISGSLGVGTTSPTARLHAKYISQGVDDPCAVFQVHNCGNSCAQPAWTEAARMWNENAGGRVGIGFVVDPAATLTTVPDVYVGTGDLSDKNDFRVATKAGSSLADRLTIDGTTGLVSVKQTLEIRGGADIVERFEASDEVEPGTVVVIDPANPGKLMRSSVAYDAKVAGVVSGAGGVNPGLCLSQDGAIEGDTLVAMNGRVYVKATAANGAIRPGDRLTTSDTSGHAMKVTDSSLSVGAVIGKAMTSLEAGEGLVLVLVNLQ